MFRLPFLALLLALAVPLGNGAAQPPIKSTSNRVWSERLGKFIHFYDHAKFKAMRAERELRYLDARALPEVKLPIDFAKNLSFPMLGNDTDGDCFYASTCHHDQTFTGNIGPQSIFSTAAVLQAYHRLSGGDNGLADSEIQGEWSGRGLAGNADAKAVDYLYIDLKDQVGVQKALACFTGKQFTFAVPNNWINNSDTGSIWDAPATPNQNNGHAVHINGIDAQGRYKVQTWGTYTLMTHAGMLEVDPSAFVVFSERSFDSKGYDSNKRHITEVAKFWKEAGGKEIPAAILNKYPSILPPSPPIPPTPGPTPIGTGSITIRLPGQAPTVYQIVPNGSKILTPEAQQFLKGLLEQNVEVKKTSFNELQSPKGDAVWESASSFSESSPHYPFAFGGEPSLRASGPLLRVEISPILKRLRFGR